MFFLYFRKGIFRTLTYLEPEAYSEHCFVKIATYLTFWPQPSKFFLKKPALKKLLIFSQKKASLIFREMKLALLHPS